jgi:hypothetical protein
MLFEYHIHFMKMILDAPKIDFAKSNLCLLTNVETFMGLDVIMPLLEIVHFFYQICTIAWHVYVLFYCNSSDLWRGCILDVLWHSFI